MNKDSEGINAQTARQTVDRSGRTTSAPNGSNARLTIGVILASAAVLVAIAQAMLGVRITGDHGSHDGGFAVVTFDLFRRAIAAGDLPSRWLMGGNCGLGSPVLYFYPPGAFLAAELVGFILPGADADTVLGFTGIIFRVASVATCTLWLRRRCQIGTALAAGGLYALLPYISIVIPQIRMAFAESAAAALLPLGFLALDVADGCFSRTLAVGAPPFAALALTHLPMTVLAAGLLSVYGGLKGTGWLDGLRRMCTTAAMVLLGLGLAGITVVPALALLPEISSSQLSVPDLRPENNFLLDMGPLLSFKHGKNHSVNGARKSSICRGDSSSWVVDDRLARAASTDRSGRDALPRCSARSSGFNSAVDAADTATPGAVPLAPFVANLPARFRLRGVRP